MKIKFEYTAPYTPQQNGLAESAFRNLWNMVQAPNNCTGFDPEKREILWVECADTMTKLDNLVNNRHC